MDQYSTSPQLQSTYYKIADHLVRLLAPTTIELDRVLPNFIPFKLDHMVDEPDVTHIEVTDVPFLESRHEWTLLSDVSVIWEERFRLEENKEAYFTSILGNRESKSWIMKSTKDFASSTIYPDINELYNSTKLSWLIMVSFGQACLCRSTVLIHASVIVKNGLGYAFLGKSGTGKSTHSRLWLAHISDTELLNDDNPAIRTFPNGEVVIYGTPWSGKTHCYKNKKARLAGLVRLRQAAQNKFEWKRGIEALTTVLPSGSAIRWDSSLFSQMVNTLESMVQEVAIAHLACLPERDAAQLCFSCLQQHVVRFADLPNANVRELEELESERALRVTNYELRFGIDD